MDSPSITYQSESRPYKPLIARKPYRNITPEALAQALDERPAKYGKSWRVRCPAHDGEDQNLAIFKAHDGGPAVKCFSHGCTPSAIWEGIHDRLQWELPPKEPKRRSSRSGPLPRGPDILTWIYQNADGSDALAVVRRNLPNGRKKITKWTPHPDGGWQPNMSGFESELKPLYRLPELLKGDCPVIVVEGEKARDALANVADGYLVTTWEGGANNWHTTDWSHLSERQVYLLSDADSSGRKAMTHIAHKLHVLGSQVSLWLREGDDGFDVADDLESTPDLGVDVLLENCETFEPTDHNDVAELPHRCFIEHYGVEEFKRCIAFLDYEVRQDVLFGALQARRRGGDWETIDNRWESRIQGEIDSTCTIVASNGEHEEPRYKRAWFPAERVRAGLEHYRYHHKGNQFEDYLLSLSKWRGSTEGAEMVINAALTEVFDCETGCNCADLHRLSHIARTLWIGPVARNFHPGIAMKLIPVIVGPPNVGKSTYLQHMLPPELAHLFSNRFNFLEDSAERYHATRGFVIIEAAEAVGLNRKGAMRYKDEVSSSVDRARPKYGREAVSVPRRYVIVVTANSDQFGLPDDDGFMVRFVTAEVKAKVGMSGHGNAKLVSKYLDEHRAKLWAAALHIWQERGAEALMPDPKLIDNAEQAASRYRAGNNLLTEFVSEYFSEQENGLGTTGEFRSWMHRNYPQCRMTTSDKRITDTFKQLGKVKSRRIRYNGKQVVFWGTANEIDEAGLDLAQSPSFTCARKNPTCTPELLPAQLDSTRPTMGHRP